MRFEFLTVALIKIALFWVVILCRLVSPSFVQPTTSWTTTKMEAVSFETLVPIYHSTWCHIRILESLTVLFTTV